MFRLSDVYDNADRWKANQQKFDEYDRKLQQEQMLADIFSNSFVSKGGQPEQVMPEGVLGPPVPAQPAGPRQLDLRMASEQSARAGLPSQAFELEKESFRREELNKQNSSSGVSPYGGTKWVRRKGGGPAVQALLDKNSGGFVVYEPGQPPKLMTEEYEFDPGQSWSDTYEPGSGNIVRTPEPKYGPGQIHLSKDTAKQKDDLSDDIIKKAIPRLDVNISAIDKKLSSGNRDLGYLRNTRLGTLFSTGEGARLKNDLDALKQTIVKGEAGLAQTAIELESVLAMLGATNLHSIYDFEYAFRKFQKAYDLERALTFQKKGEAARESLRRSIPGLDTEMSPWQREYQNNKKATGGQNPTAPTTPTTVREVNW